MNNSAVGQKEFFAAQTALVVERSETFFVAIKDALISFGMTSRKIILLKKYEEAEQFLRTQKPMILVSEYELGNKLGLGLFEVHNEVNESPTKIGIIVTRDSSDSTVAEAAEGQIDAYILKPFSGTQFKKRLSEVFDRKLNPSDYLKAIALGKDCQKKGDLKTALEHFSAAKILDLKPSLACYYCGSVHLNQNRLDEALASFREGLKYQPLHYRCLIGEFDTLMALKNYEGAHALVSVIKTNFPVTSGRLSQFFISSVFSKKFDELNGLYELFAKLENRPDSLVKLILVAFMTSGQQYLKAGQFSEAVEAFDIGVRVSGRKLEYLDKIVNECLKFKLLDAAEKFLKMFPVDDAGMVKKTQLQFRMLSQTSTPEQLIEFGRKIVMEGNGTPEIGEILVDLLMKADKLTLAETVIQKITEKYPDKRIELYKIFSKGKG